MCLTVSVQVCQSISIGISIVNVLMVVSCFDITMSKTTSLLYCNFSHINDKEVS